MIGKLEFITNMQNKNTLLAIIIILFIGLVISVGGWYRANKTFSDFRGDDAKLAGFENSLSVCDKTETPAEQSACARELAEFTKLLSKYEDKIRAIKQ